MKNRFKFLIFPIILLGIFFGDFVFAQTQTVEIDLFYLPTCSHCHEEIDFLNEIKTDYPEIKVNKHSIADGGKTELMLKKYKEYNVPQDVWGLVPVTFFEQGIYIIGFERASTGIQIESYIKQIIEDKKEIEIVSPPEKSDIEDKTSIIDDKRKIDIPFIGIIDVSGFSPLGLAIVFGILDGFNPCAMAALTFLLASLISSGTRKRILLIGGTFIFISGIVYFLFIAAWFNLFLALSYFKLITTLIGVFVIFFAITILKEYYSDVICKFCEAEVKKDIISRTQRKFLLKMEEMTRKEVPLLLSLVSVGIIAAGVNMIELFCSMGFPAAFTGMLIDFGVDKTMFYFYLLIYIFFYMLDDLIIFLIAVKTLSITQSSQKYIKTVKLISGILLLILGIVLVFDPELLNFA